MYETSIAVVEATEHFLNSYFSDRSFLLYSENRPLPRQQGGVMFLLLVCAFSDISLIVQAVALPSDGVLPSM